MKKFTKNIFRFALKKKSYLKLIFLSSLLWSCSENTTNDTNTIMLVIENRLAEPLKNTIEVFKSDLENDGYNVIINDNISDTTSYKEIRKILQKSYENDQSLSGAIFIGNITAPLFNRIKDEGDPYWHNYLADFYYMDLDGLWEDTDNDGILDKHKDTNIEIWNKIRRKLNLNDSRVPEIWVSRIRADKLTELGDEIVLLKEYFRKNHEYRTGKMSLPPHRAFTVSAGVNLSKSDWGAYPEKLYSDIDSVSYLPTLGDTLRKFLSSEEGYEWGVINVFSGPRIHHFSHFFDEINPDWWKSKDGRQLIANYSDKINSSNDVSWKDIKSIQPKVLFYHLLTSEVGRHNFKDYLGGMYIFSGSGLAAIAGTQHSGSVGSSLLYDYLAEGNTIGQSWKKALVWLVNHSEDRISIFYYPNSEQKTNAGNSNYKAVLLGDGTLKLPVKMNK